MCILPSSTASLIPHRGSLSCMQSMKCEICGKIIERKNKLYYCFSKHLSNAHGQNKEQIKNYYDKHIKSEKNGVCKICNRDTKYINFVKGYNIHYNAEFMGNEIFYPSNAGSKIYIWHILWMRIVLALLVLAAVFALLILIKVLRRRNLGTENMKLALEGNISDSADFTPEFEQTLIRDIKVQIFISFPQIKNGYPDVWGIGDELVVYFEDSWQNRDEIRMTFDNKGVYSIKVSEGTDSITNRDIRIVDYREEVIANGKLLLKEFSKSIEIDDKMTLREILFLMKSKLTNMKYLILDEIFTILEKAVYSLSDIKRDDYELFYMCIQKFKSME